jgi:hypothetical protein
MNSIDIVNPHHAPVRATPLHRSRDPLTPTIFHEPWWLEAASGGQYEEVTVSSGGRTVGRLPFVRRKSLRFTHL